MEAELTALATSGATTLVTLMATDGWTQAKERITAFFSRRGAREDGPEEVGAALDASRVDLVAARDEGDSAAAGDVEAAWRGRLRRVLREDPAAAAELRELLDELEPGSRARAAGGVHNSISGGVQHGPVIQAGTVSRLTLGSPPPRPPHAAQ